MVQEGHRIQRRGSGLNLKLQTLPGVPGVRLRFGGALCVLPGRFWTNRLKNSKIRSECARMLDSIL